MTRRLAVVVATAVIVIIVFGWPLLSALTDVRQVEAVDLRSDGNPDRTLRESLPPVVAD